ncbi:hypothetical protein ESZ91_03910 [Candidatus Borkfalkia ceftriaxoniphila]|uniref:InlB B-repeat-containing protein n=2 Tax=Candidatus Borkfalkia ceftriaxoniphila TaxID=2508949 RepID=A0A4V1QV62_9FIRM|nr:hypothetical protein ESZ91_03910 [Candidatus Borkfalkia ceftriaxoniphila]
MLLFYKFDRRLTMNRVLKGLISKTFLCALLAALLAMSFVACSGNDVKKYTVKFETNGGSDIASQQVEEGAFAVQPDDPTKTDYIFNGWYEDADLSKTFDFETQAITADTTIYAGWTSESEATSATATFYWNYEGAPDNGIYSSKIFVSGGRLTKPTNPTRSGYTFEAWYLDKEYSEKFVNNSVYSGNLSLYARWMKQYTFEAEDTQLTGLDPDTDLTANTEGNKKGVGFSSNFSGTGLIGNDSAASNGKAVHGLYYEGAYLDFEITSDKAEKGASLSLRISSEYRAVTLTQDSFQVMVNGTVLAYKTGDIEMDWGEDYMDGVWDSGSDHRYVTVVINNIDLKGGENLIRLYVNNANGRPDGTVAAMAPIVDCIYINSSSALKMTVYENK